MGALGEAMLYYGEVRVIADRGVLKQLLRTLPQRDLFRALSEGFIRLTYHDGFDVIHTEDTGSPSERHRPTTVHIHKNPDGDSSFDDIVESEFLRKTRSWGRARNLRQKLASHVEMREWDTSTDEGVLADFANRDYITKAARLDVAGAVPEIDGVDQCRFDLHKVGDFYRVDTDLDFGRINSEFHKMVSPKITTITPASILADLMDSRIQLWLATEYEADLDSDQMTSRLLQLKCEDIILQSTTNSEKVQLFQDRVLKGRAVREAINSGQRSFSELLDIVEDAKRFRSWIASKPDDEELLQAYYNEIDSRSWVEGLQARVARWAVFGGTAEVLTTVLPPTAAGAIGLGLSAIDTLFLTRILGGWHPNQFVNNRLTPFLDD